MEQKPADNAKSTNKEIAEGKAMAIIAYIIALIPYFAGDKKNKFVRFHAIQGMNILLIAVGYSILAGIINSIVWSAIVGNCYSSLNSILSGCNFGLASTVSFIIWLPAWVIGIVSIIGIVNAANGKEKEVPILGKVKIIKK